MLLSENDLKSLIQKKQRRLRKLREQEAVKGLSVDPSIPIEIEDMESELIELQTQLRQMTPNTELTGNFLELRSVTESYFDCGHRIREAREDLDLSTSKFIEAINYHSEKHFKNIEQRQEECPTSILHRISQLTGISTEWLKHGTDYKYPYSDLDPHDINNFVGSLKNLNPTNLYFCTETKHNEVVLVVQTSIYNWQIVTFQFRLDFWNWMEDHWYIPRVYEIIDRIHEEFHFDIYGRIYPTLTFEKLSSMMHHPKMIIESSKVEGRHWSDDIRDAYHTSHTAKGYSSYGKWFLKVQEYFKQYCEPGQIKTVGNGL